MNGLFEFEFGLIFWQTIILAITFFVLGKFAWKPILRFIHDQEQAYDEAAQKADEQVKKTVELAKEHEHMLTQLHEKRRKLMEEALVTKKKVLEETKQEAAKMREAMLTQAEEDIFREKQATFRELKRQAGLLSIQLAEQLLHRELSDKHKQDEFLTKLIADAYANEKSISHNHS